MIMDSLETIHDLIKSSLLPELKQDLDSIPIEREHFKNYHECVQHQLPLIYDWIQQQQKLNCPFNVEGNERTKREEIQAYLIVLLCEISCHDSIFKLNTTELTKNAERVLQNYGRLTKEVEEFIFRYYEDKFHKDKWKRQIGAIHGFVRYLEFHFCDARDHVQIATHKFLTFCLSVALNIRSCYETHYKNLSTTIFLIMLQQGPNEDILSMNIHSVIYDAVFKDTHIMDSIPFIIKQWNCLIKCLDFNTNFDSFTWNYLDDMMEVLIRNVSLAPDSSTSICLLKFVSKLIVYFTINNTEFEKMLTKDLHQIENINNFRLLASTNTSHTNYRWAKHILQMFIIESHKLMQTPEICKQLLMEIHKIYIVTIIPIGLSVIQPHLVIFLEKFIAVLMETVRVQKYREDILQAITLLLETFYFNLQTCDESLKLFNFKENIYKVIKVKPFLNYSSI